MEEQISENKISTSLSQTNYYSNPYKPPIYSLDEVQKHNTEEDCWTVFHGKVYDVTKYLAKHPGGKHLILKNAGKDFTSDFEGMFHSRKARLIIQEYYIGDLKEGKGSSLNPFSIPMSSLNREKGPYGLGVYTSFKSSSSNKPFVPPSSKSLRVEKFLTPLPQKPSKALLKCELFDIIPFNYNTKRLIFKKKHNWKVPIVYHLKVFLKNNKTNEEKIWRCYTPIREDSDHFELLVKIYKNGKLSQYMNQLEKGNEIEILGPIPTFEYISNSYQTLLLICCGTGITPIFQIINKILYDPKDTTKLLLFFANRTEEDILLKDELTQLGNSFPNRLKMFFILSQPQSDYILKGHINETMFRENIPEEKEKIGFLICGTEGFSKLTKSLLIEKLQYLESQIHIFE